MIDVSFKKTIRSKSELISTIDALDELGKKYVITSKFEPLGFYGDTNKEYKELCWVVEELNDSEINAGNITVNITAETAPEFDRVLKELRECASAVGVKVAEALENVSVKIAGAEHE